MKLHSLLSLILLVQVNGKDCVPDPKPTPTPIPVTTTTTSTTLPPQTHPICWVETPRWTDCYHNPTGEQWLYACPFVDGVSINVLLGQELTCPVKTPLPTPGPGPTPVPSGKCVKQSGDHVCTELLPGDFKDKVNKALSQASQCSVGSDCTISNWQFVIVRTMEILEADGFCTSYDLDSGNCWKFYPDGVTCLKRGFGSEMGLRKGTDLTEYYQIITANKKARWADTRSICRPAFDEENLTQVRTFLEVSTPAPTPSPIIDPTPVPVGQCPLILNRDHDIRVKVAIKTGGAGARWLDVTYEYYYGVKEDGTNAGPCGDPTTHAPRRWCDLGVDGGPYGVICQNELAGDPKFWVVDPSLILAPNFRGNANLAQIFGSGRARICASKQSLVCTDVTVNP